MKNKFYIENKLSILFSIFAVVYTISGYAQQLNKPQKRGPRFFNMESPTQPQAINTQNQSSSTATNTGNQPSAQQEVQNSIQAPQINSSSFRPIILNNSQPLTKRQAVAASDSNNNIVYLRIAAGSEKQKWLNWAKDEWTRKGLNKLSNNKTIEIIIESGGSVESGRQIAEGNHTFQVWAPASSIFKNLVEERFQGSAFSSQESLVQSPVVFAVHKPMHDILKDHQKYKNKAFSFTMVTDIYRYEEFNPDKNLKSSIGDANFFKFGLTNPSRSNSGIVGLLIASFEYFANSQSSNVSQSALRLRKLTPVQLNNPQLQQYLALLKSSSDTTQSSTGLLADKLSRESELDAALIYESDAINEINNSKKNALSILYPQYSAVCDHPFYTLRDKVSTEQTQAALAFLEFLKLPDQQLAAMRRWGFRPVHFPGEDASSLTRMHNEIEKYFSRYEKNGLKPDLRKVSRVLDPQEDSVIRGLIEIFEKVNF
jgi:hypothetical protein